MKRKKVIKELETCIRLNRGAFQRDSVKPDSRTGLYLRGKIEAHQVAIQLLEERMKRGKVIEELIRFRRSNQELRDSVEPNDRNWAYAIGKVRAYQIAIQLLQGDEIYD